MSTKTIFGTNRAWLTDRYTSLKDLKAMDPDRMVGKLMYYSADMSDAGWIEVGTAQIAVTLLDEADIDSKQVETLTKEIQEVRAEAQRKIQGLEQRIQELLALPNLENDDA